MGTRPGKGAELLGRFDPPLQHCGVGDLEDPRRGANTEPLGQAGQDRDNQLHGDLLAMEDRPVVVSANLLYGFGHVNL